MDLTATSPTSPPLSRRGALMGLSIICCVYITVVLAFANRGYVDFGDGNYMYISWRLQQGAMLYRDVLAPQPPLHLLTGAGLAWIAKLTGEPVLPFRIFSTLLHAIVAVLVFFSAKRVAGGNGARERAGARAAGVWAAGIYLFLPLGFWWSIGYQSEPLELLFLMLGFVLFISWEPGRAVGAGVAGALAPLVNMTAAPYTLFNIGYAAVRHPRLFLRYALPVVVIIAAVIVGMEFWTGAYLENVILNQVGSFPRTEFLGEGQSLWTYARDKIIREGADVLRLEGGFVLLALLGLMHYSRRGHPEHREYVSWFSFFALCSIIYVSKGGTMDYIFTIGEPFVAIFAGYFLFVFFRSIEHVGLRLPLHRDLSPLVTWIVAMIVGVIICAPGVMHSWATLNQRTYELGEYDTAYVVDQIEKNSKPTDLVLSPPYYAYLAKRQIVEDYSEIFLWSLKYHNERFDKQNGRGVQTVERIAAMLKQKNVAFVVLDLDQTAKIPEIKSAIDENYEPLRTSEFKTLNTRLMFYKPKP